MPAGVIRWVLRETDPQGETQRVEITVTDRTKLVAGVTVRIVRDVATEGGRPVEVTDDYYAQDRAGNLLFFGEATTEYENGKPTTTKGSWEAGVDGAQAGVAIPAVRASAGATGWSTTRAQRKTRRRSSASASRSRCPPATSPGSC